MTRPRGLFIGRFQPPHNGHVEALKAIRSELESLTIVIGSAQHSHAPENPFTAGERVAMLEAVLAEAGIDARIIPIFDMHRNTIWVSHVQSMVPPFDVVYTNNPLPARLFGEAGVVVKGFPLVEREGNSGQAIRELMRDGGDWQAHVPKGVAALIEAFDGPGRMRDVGGHDDPGRKKAWIP